MRAPDFWRHDGFSARALLPIGWAFGAAGALRQAGTTPFRAGVPVLCIGNLVAGGAGKTPVALSVAEILIGRGISTHFLSRGYGGRLSGSGPVAVDGALHGASDVGDEPLLLARLAPTWVSRDRAAGAAAAVDAGAGAIVMDDGFQNPSVAKDVSLLVVDGAYGFGNRRVMPAGPLREPVKRGLARADAMVLIGEDTTGVSASVPAGKPLLRARIVPTPGGPTTGGPMPSGKELAGGKVVAMAGIGRPEKFFATLRDMGCDIVEHRAFADHHVFREAEIMEIVERAAAAGATPVTTAKDAVRLPPDARAMFTVLDIALEWEDPEALTALLRPVLDAAGARADG